MEKAAIIIDEEGKIKVSDEYVIAIQSCLSTSRDGLFAAGDLMVALLEQYGRKNVEPVMRYLSGALGVQKKQLYDYVNTSRRWSPEQRAAYPKFDWTVFRNSDPVRDKELLDKAHDEGLSTSAIKKQLFPESPAKLLREAMSAMFKLMKFSKLPPSFQNEIATLYEKLKDIYSELDDDEF